MATLFARFLGPFAAAAWRFDSRAFATYDANLDSYIVDAQHNWSVNRYSRVRI
jgi:hypothetical protein